jgi:hypothetical protein
LVVHHHGKTDLLHVREARGLSCFGAGFRENGEKYRGKNGDNGDNNEQLDQSEGSRTGGYSASVHDFLFLFRTRSFRKCGKGQRE